MSLVIQTNISEDENKKMKFMFQMLYGSINGPKFGREGESSLLKIIESIVQDGYILPGESSDTTSLKKMKAFIPGDVIVI